MDARRVGQAGLIGWRAKVGERAAGAISARTRLTEDHARAVLGAVFFVITTRSFIRMVRRAARAARE